MARSFYPLPVRPAPLFTNIECYTDRGPDYKVSGIFFPKVSKDAEVIDDRHDATLRVVKWLLTPAQVRAGDSRNRSLAEGGD
jgi:hypothetical protein